MKEGLQTCEMQRIASALARGFSYCYFNYEMAGLVPQHALALLRDLALSPQSRGENYGCTKTI